MIPMTSADRGLRTTRSTQEFRPPPAISSKRVYRRGRYQSSRLAILTSRYIRIRGDLLLESGRLGQDVRQLRVAIVCAEFLEAAKKELESHFVNFPLVANQLSMAERALVDLYRPKILALRLQTIQAELSKIDSSAAEIAALARFSDAMGTEQSASGDDYEDVRTALKDGTTRINGHEEEDLVRDDLQVSRLNRIIVSTLAGWILLVASIPLITSLEAIDGEVVWPVLRLGRGAYIDLLGGALGLSIVGAVGGIVSGMLAVRDSPARIGDYRTSLRKLALKPVFGAIAAVIVYLFLNANVISGINVTSSGVYVVAAFLAGFSERYFVRLVNAQMMEQYGPSGSQPPPAPQ